MGYFENINSTFGNLVITSFVSIKNKLIIKTNPFYSTLSEFDGSKNINKSKKLTKKEQDSFLLPTGLKEILIGLIIGDLNIQKQSVNTRLRFEQGLVHEAYLLHLYDLFKDYCRSEPKK
jgi:hypothetical protein